MKITCELQDSRTYLPPSQCTSPLSYRAGLVSLSDLENYAWDCLLVAVFVVEISLGPDPLWGKYLSQHTRSGVQELAFPGSIERPPWGRIPFFTHGFAAWKSCATSIIDLCTPYNIHPASMKILTSVLAYAHVRYIRSNSLLVISEPAGAKSTVYPWSPTRSIPHSPGVSGI